MKKKFLALVMTLSMVLSLVPMTALATEGSQAGQTLTAAEGATGGETGGTTGSETGGTTGSETGGTTGSETGGTTGSETGGTTGSETGGTTGSETGSTTGSGTGGTTGSETGGTTGSGTGGTTGGETSSTPANVAKIGTTEYASIADAIATADDSEPIVLLRDVTENITINKSLTLDLAGFTLSGDATDSVVTITGEDTIVTITSSALNEDETVKNGTITGGVGSKDHKFCFGGGVFIIEATVTLKNLTVSKNYADKVYDNTANYDRSGGGGIASVKADLTLDNVTVTDNYINNHSDGGGVCALGGQLIINNSKIENNASDDNGGGIYTENTVLKIHNGVIKNNRAPIAGGIYTVNDKDIINKGQNYQLGTKVVSIPTEGSTISDTTIESNIASGMGGGLYIGGQNELTISNSTISGNNGASQGGAIVAYSADTIELDNVSITENTSESGAGIFSLCTAVCETNIVLKNGTKVDKNGATASGGGIYAYAMGNKVNVTVDNSSVNDNTAVGGAGIFAIVANSEKANLNVNLQSGATVNDNTATGNFGGGIYAYAMGNNLNVSVADSSISGNTANNGAGIFTYALPDPTTQEITAEINVNLNSGATMHKNTATTGSGGAIYAYDKSAHINVAEGSALYNNTAKNAGDDLWMHDATFTLPNASEMSGDKQFKISDEENGTVTGWFYDGWFKWDPNAPSASGEAETKGAYVEAARWSMDKADEYSPKDNDTQAIALKAATKKAPSPGGSGGGHRPSNPPVTIPDDVPTGLNGKDHYAYVVGYPDGMVYPQKNITRAEVATIFFRLLEDETREANMTKSNGYNDMKDGAWYTCAVSTLSKMGIIKGYEDGSFKPDASISRAELAAIAARFDPDGDKTPATFSDVSSHWAKDEISIAANHGWIKGYEDGSFKPDQKITRAETMTLVNRVLKRLPETKDDLHKDMKTWPDNQNESAWFYLAVQEATNSHYQNLKKDGTHEKWESMRETRDWAALEK